MEFDCRSIPLERIDAADTTYRISFGSSLPAIESSIRQIGLINTPILLSGENRHVVVSGFARIAVCRRLGWRRIDARCLSAETPYLTIASLAIADNAAQRELNIVEVARSSGLIVRQSIDPDEQTAVLRSLGLSVNRDLLLKLNQVLQMSQRLQLGLAQGTISLPVALRLHGLQDSAAAEELVQLFAELRLGLNRQRELLDWIEAIGIREGICAAEILNRDPIATWRRDKTKDRGHISQLIRQYLKRCRYPEISAWEHRYAQCLKKLHLPANLRIDPPPHFEGRKFHLRFDFQHKQELYELNRELQRIINSPLLLELLSPTVSDQA